MRFIRFIQKYAGVILTISLFCVFLLSIQGVLAANESAWTQAVSIVNSTQLVSKTKILYKAVFPCIIVGDLIAYVMTSDDRTKSILKKCMISAVIIWIILVSWNIIVIGTINNSVIPAAEGVSSNATN